MVKIMFRLCLQNLYGPYDNFDLETSHVLPAMIRKFDMAKENEDLSVELWGTGEPLREFLHVNDLAEAVIYCLENYLTDHLYNVGSGDDLAISELATMVKKVVNYQGSVIWDVSKPNGTPRKLMDSTRIRDLGWLPKIDLEMVLGNTYQWYLDEFKR